MRLAPLASVVFGLLIVLSGTRAAAQEPTLQESTPQEAGPQEPAVNEAVAQEPMPQQPAAQAPAAPEKPVQEPPPSQPAVQEPMPQQPALALGPLISPEGPGPFRWRLGLGLMLDVLPARVVDASPREYPHLALQFRYGLPRGFSADIKLNAVIVSNEVQIGVAWAHAVGPVVLAIHEHVAVWYSRIGSTGFDATGWGIMSYNGFSVGTAARGSWFALTGEAIFVHAQHVKFGRAHVDRTNLHRGGFIFTLSVETPVRHGLILYGVSAIRADPDYQMWQSFSDNPYKQIYPRFFAGYAF